MEETVRGLTNLGDRVSDGGGCKAAATARTRCGWVSFRECCELLYGGRFPLRLKGAVSMSLGQLARTNSVCWYRHVLRMALDFEVVVQRMTEAEA